MSNRNIRLIGIAVLLFISLLYYLIPYRMLNNIESRNRSEVNSLQSQINVLQQDVNKKQQYLEEIVFFGEEIEIINNKFPQSNSLERIIYTITDIENELEISFPNVIVAASEVVKTSNDDAYKLEKTYIDELIEAKENNSQEEVIKPEIPVYDKFIRTSVQTETTVDYQGLKDLLNYIYPEMDETGQYVNLNKNKSLNKRSVVRNINIEKSKEIESDKSFEVAFVLDLYALTNEERALDKIYLGEFNIGKPNGIFEVYESLGNNDSFTEESVVTGLNLGKKIESKSDFFMMLNPVAADDSTVVVGSSESNASKTYVYDEKNGVSDVTFEFYMYNNNYYYRYKAGNESYPNNYNSGIKFIPGEYIEIGVYSALRNSTNDLSGANVTILNKTDIDVNVYFEKEDSERPRFRLAKTSGVVITP